MPNISSFWLASLKVASSDRSESEHQLAITPCVTVHHVFVHIHYLPVLFKRDLVFLYQVLKPSKVFEVKKIDKKNWKRAFRFAQGSGLRLTSEYVLTTRVGAYRTNTAVSNTPKTVMFLKLQSSWSEASPKKRVCKNAFSDSSHDQCDWSLHSLRHTETHKWVWVCTQHDR